MRVSPFLTTFPLFSLFTSGTHGTSIPNPPEQDHSHHHMDHSHHDMNSVMTPSIKSSLDCISNSQDPSCSGYIYPSDHVSSDISSLCEEMPYMPGCVFRGYCHADHTYLGSKPICSDFSILADLCFDMPRMKGCHAYTQLCKPESKVTQCTTEKRFEPLPKYSVTKKLAIDICEEMTMTGCEKVYKDKSFDVLPVYGQLCLAMPEMSQCGIWKSLCDAEPHLPFCPSSSSPSAPQFGGPTMKMFFHWGYKDYVLVESWVPSDAGSFFWACLFCFLTGVVYEALLAFQNALEEFWCGRMLMVSMKKDKSRESGVSSNVTSIVLEEPPIGSSSRKRGTLSNSLEIEETPASSTSSSSQRLSDEGKSFLWSTKSSDPLNQSVSWDLEDAPLLRTKNTSSNRKSLFRSILWTPLKIRIVRSLMRMITISGAYICMLLVMSFNTGLFLSVIFGLGVGSFLFHPDPWDANMSGLFPLQGDLNTESAGVSTPLRVKPPRFSTSGKEHCC